MKWSQLANWGDDAIVLDGIVIHGAIDCTSHYRQRVHPGQSFFYRGDKRAHFITAQVYFSNFLEIFKWNKLKDLF